MNFNEWLSEIENKRNENEKNVSASNYENASNSNEKNKTYIICYNK